MMIKKIVLVLMTVIVCSGLAEAGLASKFFDDLIKMSKGSADDIVRKIPAKAPKDVVPKPNFPAAIKINPEKIILANKAEKITAKGDFEKKFFSEQKFDNQLSIIVQSSKYGDEYFVMVKNISAVSPDILKSKAQFVKYIPDRHLTPEKLQTKFIDTLNKTGKYGWERLQEIGKWVAANPKISAAGGAYLWYVLDPEGFNEQLESSGKTLTVFLMDATGSIIQGIGKAPIEKIEKVTGEIKDDFEEIFQTGVDGINSSYILQSVAGILVLIGLFIVWRKRKIIQHFITKADEVQEDKSHGVKNISKFEKDQDEF
jgi:hypothetical protein